MSRVAHFVPDGAAMTEHEKVDPTACRRWTLDEMEATGDNLTPRDLAARLRVLSTDGPPPSPIEVGI